MILARLIIYTFDMAIAGAAYAPILSQVMALVWQMKLLTDKRELLHIRGGTFGLEKSIVQNILGIGMSPFAMNVCACVVVIFVNKGLQEYGGDLSLGAYGIANRMAFIFVMITMGINQGMQPIAGYNFGAQRMDRLMQVLKYSIIAATVVTTTGFLVAELVPTLCARLFTSDATLIGMSATAIRIIMVTFPIVGFQMVITNFFQSIGKAKISMFLSLSRQMLFLLPLLITLPLWFGVDGIWWAMPISDTIAALVTLVLMATYMKKFRSKYNCA